MPTINVPLTVDGLDTLQEYLERLETVFPQALDYACERIANEAVDEIDFYFGASSFEGNNGYSLSVEKTDNGWQITATGEDVFFIEFGAGIYTEQDQFAQEAGVEINPGSWSRSPMGKGVFASRGYWFVNGRGIKGLPASHGMEHGLEWIRANADRILNEEVSRLL